MIDQIAHYGKAGIGGTVLTVSTLNWETASAALALGFIGAIGGLFAGFLWRKVFPKKKSN